MKINPTDCIQRKIFWYCGEYQFFLCIT